MAQEENLQSRDTYVNALATSLVNGQSLANVPGLLKKIIAGNMWQERVVKQTKEKVRYTKFVDFVQDYPPDGLHTKMDVLMRICQSYQDMEAVDLLAQVSAGSKGGNNNPYGQAGKPETGINVDNVNIDSAGARPTGNSAAATMRRLSKDYPSIHERVLSGELSPNAAAIEAGFRARKMQLSTDPAAAGKYLAGHVDAEWMLACYEAFMEALEQ